MSLARAGTLMACVWRVASIGLAHWWVGLACKHRSGSSVVGSGLRSGSPAVEFGVLAFNPARRRFRFGALAAWAGALATWAGALATWAGALAAWAGALTV